FRTADDVVDHRTSVDADIRVLHLAGADQFLDDRGDVVDRDGEAEADGTARLRLDGRVDSDDAAFHVHQRPARVTRVDGSIGLNRVDHGVGVGALPAQPHRPVEGADDPAGDGL